MKAAVWKEINQIDYQDIPEPELKPGEVKIKVLGCGVCGTDVHIQSGEVPLAKPPQVLGHEIYGQVIKPGESVQRFQEGDTVSVNPVVGCGICTQCREGYTNLCPHPTIIGYARCGGFAQYTTVPQTHLHPFSAKIGPKGGILVETLACVINGYDRLNLKAGKSVLILGAGTVGLLWTSLIRKSVVTRIIQTEIIPYRGQLAKQLGADFYLDSSPKNWLKEIQKIEPDGMDYIIDTTGSASAVQESFQLLKKGGTFMIFGVCPADEKITLSPYEIFAKEINIIGAKMPPRTLDRAAKIIEAGLIDYNSIVSTIFPLQELPKAIKDFQYAKDKHIKIMINPWIET